MTITLKNKHLIFFLFFSCFLLACSNNKKAPIYGFWTIGLFHYDGSDYGNYLKTNNFTFSQNNELSVPLMVNYENLSKAKWSLSLLEGQIDTINITAENAFYDGDYKVRCLVNSVNPVLFMELKSQHKEIVMYKKFRIMKERDDFIRDYGLITTLVSDEYYPYLEQFIINRVQ